MRIALLIAAALAPLQTVPLPNVDGRIDHLAADPAGGRLFVAALGNHTVEVIDVRSGKRARTLTGLPQPQGLLYLPERNRLFAATAGDGSVRIYDTSSYRQLDTVKLGSDADNIRFDAQKKEVYVGYGDGALGILEADTGRQIGVVNLDAHPESFQLEKNGPRIFVNVPDRDHIAVVDRTKRDVVDRWPVREAHANFPMALDEGGHMLITGCRKPPKALVFDTQAGRQVASFPICGDTDDLFFDAPRKRLYVICGEGFVDVFAQQGPAQYTRVQQIATVPGARTGLFVPDLNRLFVAVRKHGEEAAEVRVFEAK